MFKIIVTIVLLNILFFSCSKDNPVLTGYGSLELVFKARYGTEPLVYGNQYNYFGAGTIQFSSTDFFYSSLKLLNSTDSVLVKEVDYISLMAHHKTIELAEQGLKIHFDSIPDGNYSSLNFNIGLSAEQNKTKPEDYPPTSALAESSRYWSGWSSYIFTKTEGTYNNGTIYNFGYHSGFDASERSLHFPQNIIIKDGANTNVVIQIDYKKMFDLGGTGMDIPNKPIVQDASAFMMSLLDRFQAAITVK